MHDFRMGASVVSWWRREGIFLALSLTLFLTPMAAGARESRSSLGAVAVLAPVASSLCLAGCPRGAPSDNRVIQRKSYVLSNNGGTKFADWVVYVVTPARFGPPRQRAWRSDPGLPGDETLEPEDYKAAHATIGTDRGHQAPLASFAGSDDWWATNYLSNVTPQKSGLNRGPWARLEAAIRRLAESPRINSVHVATGPLYERTMPGLPNADESHSVPSGYWKVIAIPGPNGLEAAGFVMDQDLTRSADFCASPQRIDIPGLERRAGLRLFPDLDRRAATALVTSARSMARRLGCDD